MRRLRAPLEGITKVIPGTSVYMIRLVLKLGEMPMKLSNWFLKGLGAVAAVGLFLTFGLDASAQDTMKKTPAPKAKAAKPASACKGLEEAACKGKTAECAWIAPKTGKQKPYCRAKPAKK